MLGVLEFGEFFLGGEEVDLVAVGDLELGLHLGGSLDVGLLVVDERWKSDGFVFEVGEWFFGNGVDGFFCLFDEFVKAGNLGVVFVLAAANSVVEHRIDRANDVGDVFGFAGNGSGEFGGSPVGFGEFTEEFLGHPGTHDTVALVVEMDAVVSVGICALVGFLGEGEEVEEDRIVAGGNLLDGFRIG